MRGASKLKGYFLLLFAFLFGFSCEDDGVETFKMRVNHYTQPMLSSYTHGTESFLVQTGNKIGSTEWDFFSQSIKGLNFELGYTYDLIVQRKPEERDLADAPSAYYSAIQIVRKTKVPDTSTFEILLAQGEFQLVTIDESASFKTTNGINIQCESLCDELVEKINGLALKDYTYGTFTHVNANTIRLVNIETRVVEAH